MDLGDGFLEFESVEFVDVMTVPFYLVAALRNQDEVMVVASTHWDKLVLDRPDEALLE